MSHQDPYPHDPYNSDPYAPGDSTPDPYGAAPGIPTNMPPAPGPYGPHPYGPQPYGAPGYAYPPPQPTNVSALILTILSGILALSCYCTIPGVVGLIFGILGLTKQSTDPAEAARMTKYGWIAFAALMALSLIGFGIFIAAMIASESSTTY